ncbi:KPN_02809 family neutral zinc metallopeptidase [Deinococcus cellulosilyticus]|uniref:Metallopeptidase n=1 Tax=Deinococcus cellulosilyticus (strain DSM 18568 / NBRC 106333 / KACC 11606 / 5516J-15) TaxID=1223518 RepID=A0A511N7L0_DEIC1|nr:neutral zinc metallopeptidase [Deinococcus cellulosilyticus]GEM48456.1 metallopeptidase [Deinococcus cellulosilyticus NBRC 106333 = KACC 11606]
MDWKRLGQSGNVEDRRGIPGGGLAIGGGAGLIILIVSLLFGGNPGQILNQLNGNSQQTAQPKNDEIFQFTKAVLGSTDEYWGAVFQKSGRTYREPTLALFTAGTQTACGNATSATGPFYCPNDQKIYVDPSFFDTLASRFDAKGDFAAAYVIAHEVGHHVQNELNILDQVQASGDRQGANSAAVRLELQADCFAGVWANSLANTSNPIVTAQDINEGRVAAQSVGDDALQERSRGYSDPETFTHGTSAQRDQWFSTGVRTGDPNKCNTFR